MVRADLKLSCLLGRRVRLGQQLEHLAPQARGQYAAPQLGGEPRGRAAAAVAAAIRRLVGVGKLQRLPEYVLGFVVVGIVVHREHEDEVPICRHP